MKSVFWYRGRFSWTVLSLFVYTTLCVLTFDYVWRRIEMPFALLFVAGASAWVVGSGIVIRIGRSSQRRTMDMER